MADKIMYLGFVVFVWLIYIAFSMSVLIFFMSFNQAFGVALTVATFIMLLFILVQQTLQFLFSNEYQ